MLPFTHRQRKKWAREVGALNRGKELMKEVGHSSLEGLDADFFPNGVCGCGCGVHCCVIILTTGMAFFKFPIRLCSSLCFCPCLL